MSGGGGGGVGREGVFISYFCFYLIWQVKAEHPGRRHIDSGFVVVVFTLMA